MTERELDTFLRENHADFELLRQDRPILSAADAAAYYPPEKAAPMLVLQTESGLIGCAVSAGRGRLDFEALKRKFHYEKLKMADRARVKRQTGYDVGAVPLIGLGLPCLFDLSLLNHDMLYGGSGDALVTLKIAPRDVMRLNPIIGTFE